MSFRALRLVVPLIVVLLLAACGGAEQGERVIAGARAVDERGAAATNGESDAISAFAELFASLPYYTATDFMVPPDVCAWQGDARGVIGGTVKSVEIGPAEPVELATADGYRVTIDRISLELVVKVDAADPAPASDLAVGATARVVIPIWQGPKGSGEQQLAPYAEQLRRGPGAGTRALVAVGGVDGAVVTPASITGVVLGTDDGSASFVLTAPKADGKVFGASDIRAIDCPAG